MIKLFEQIRAGKVNPSRAGWYNTDKGLLFWYDDVKEWSCRDDRVSEEYPNFWYKAITKPLKPSLHAEDCPCVACIRYKQELI